MPGGGGAGAPVDGISPAKEVAERTHAIAIAIAKRLIEFLLELLMQACLH